MQVIVKLTNQCNLRCTYCSEGNPSDKRYLLEAVCQKMLAGLPELLDFCHDRKIDILWHGGEPLVYPREALCRLMDYAQDILSGYHLSFSMQTNGYAVDDDWLEVFRKYSVHVGVSLDGYQELHDQNRRTADGQNSFVKIVSNIQKMQQAGIAVGTLMVLDTTQEIDIDKLLDLSVSVTGNIKIHPVIACGRAENRQDIDLVNQRYVELMKKLFARCVERDDYINISPLRELLEAIIGNTDIGECSYGGTCGKKFICLYSDGEVGACGRRIRGHEYGSILDRSLLDLYNSPVAQKIRSRDAYLTEHDCQNCRYWKWCHGGCSFEAFNGIGDIFAKNLQCAARKQLIQYIMEDGVSLLKQKLIQRRNAYRKIIKLEKEILKEIEDA